MGDDGHTARGARLAVFGPVGMFLDVESMQHAIDGVRPLTLLGAVNVTLWLVVVAVTTVAGRVLLGGDGRLWAIGAVVAMSLVATRWPWTTKRVRARLAQAA